MFQKWLFSSPFSPVFKKNDNLDKENYRSVSLLCPMSKVFERIIYIEVASFMEGKLSKLLTRLRKKSLQRTLLNQHS